jgi:hypothetical protein
MMGLSNIRHLGSYADKLMDPFRLCISAQAEESDSIRETSLIIPLNLKAHHVVCQQKYCIICCESQ